MDIPKFVRTILVDSCSLRLPAEIFRCIEAVLSYQFNKISAFRLYSTVTIMSTRIRRGIQNSWYLILGIYAYILQWLMFPWIVVWQPPHFDFDWKPARSLQSVFSEAQNGASSTICWVVGREYSTKNGLNLLTLICWKKLAQSLSNSKFKIHASCKKLGKSQSQLGSSSPIRRTCRAKHLVWTCHWHFQNLRNFAREVIKCQSLIRAWCLLWFLFLEAIGKQ